MILTRFEPLDQVLYMPFQILTIPLRVYLVYTRCRALVERAPALQKEGRVEQAKQVAKPMRRIACSLFCYSRREVGMGTPILRVGSMFPVRATYLRPPLPRVIGPTVAEYYQRI